MRLISLTANKESFHPVQFNETGPSLIVAVQKNKKEKDKGKTYNGVGKSLLIALIHFCLGSSKKEEFEKKLPGWEFILHFEHNGKQHRVSRFTENQSVVNFDGEEVKLKAFSDLLEPLVFSLPKPIPYLKFRPLLNSFIRPRKSSYIAFDITESKSKPYEQLLRTGFLLGLDIDLIKSKYDLRIEQDNTRKLRQNLANDPVFVEFFTDNKIPDIELLDLERKIMQSRDALANFRIADDYHERQKEADASTRRVQILRNEQVVIHNAIESIDKSLEIVPDVSPEMLFQMYEEAERELPERVKKKIDDVAAFHKKLMLNRIRRLTSEKNRLIKEMEKLKNATDRANQEADELRRFLGTHGALDEYMALSESVVQLEARAQKLRDYKELLDTYSNRTQELTAALSTETIKTNRYIKEIKVLLDSNMERFRSFSSRFYGDRPGGLTVKNNEGDNQIRFDINARIEDDAADGINEVKIFCFDMTILTQKHNHSVNFLVHDSRLFSDIDKRQRATIFKVAHEVTKDTNLQYIATMNQDQIEAMRDQFQEEEFINCLEKCIVLKLTDENAEAKLLGIQVDMHYDNDS